MYQTNSMNIEKLRIVLSMYREDIVKLNDPHIIDIERDAIIKALDNSFDKLLNKLKYEQRVPESVSSSKESIGY